MREYKLFISHSWTHENDYNGLVSLLEGDPYFYFYNYSVPKDDPIHATSDKQLREKIREQMAPASCILILAGVYSTFSKWINIEIDLAKSGFNTPKKIIAVEKWGAKRSSTVVEEAADEIVKWNTKSIVDAIRKVCTN